MYTKKSGDLFAKINAVWNLYGRGSSEMCLKRKIKNEFVNLSVFVQFSHGENGATCIIKSSCSLMLWSHLCVKPPRSMSNVRQI